MGWVHSVEPLIPTGRTCCFHILTVALRSLEPAQAPQGWLILLRLTVLAIRSDSRYPTPLLMRCPHCPAFSRAERWPKPSEACCTMRLWVIQRGNTNQQLDTKPHLIMRCNYSAEPLVLTGRTSCFIPRGGLFQLYQDWFTQWTMCRLVFNRTLWDFVRLFPGTTPGFSSAWIPNVCC